ncbi:MAG: DUF5995 family protein [Solirubrobacterales bacterium]|nr:DUF5995 family protein [Solirubrobacterales bacterium]
MKLPTSRGLTSPRALVTIGRGGTSAISDTLDIGAIGTAPDHGARDGAQAARGGAMADRDGAQAHGDGAQAARLRATTIAEVIAEMTAIGARLPSTPGPGFGVRCFNQLYLAVTRAVEQAVEEASYFEDPRQLAQLDVMFAQLYFDAVEAHEAGAHLPLAWRVLFEHCGSDDILPIQFAIAGMNAHINHDLPIALLEQWTGHGHRPPTPGPAHDDFTKMNQILKSEEAREKASLVPSDLRDVEALDHDLLGRIDSRLALWVVESARAGAWERARELWDLRHVPLARKFTLAAIDRVTAGWGDAFLLPV